MKNVQISIKFLVNVYQEMTSPPVEKLNILCFWCRHADIVFPRL